MLAAGSTFDRYRIEAELGDGGMGRVYRALDTRLQRRVALKVLKVDADARGEAAAKLMREARLAAALHHPNVVAIFDVGEVEGTPFVSMELVTGTNLRAFVGDPSVPLPVRAAWLVSAASALGAAHKRGLVHRDIKPENVMLSDEGVIKVLDFGIARRSFEADATLSESMASDALKSRNSISGTPMYMAPEQIRGEALDGRCDQFAWGVMAYELFSGTSPWGEGDVMAVLGRALTVGAPPLAVRCPELPAPAAAIVERALAKHAAERFETMEDVVAALVESGLVAPASIDGVSEGRAVAAVAAARKAPASPLALADTARASTMPSAAAGPHASPEASPAPPSIQATHFRERLGPRDRAFLAALEACVMPAPATPAACHEGARKAALAYPRDAQIVALEGQAAGAEGHLDGALAGMQAALALDPHFAAAAALGAEFAAYLGRFDDAQRLIDQCVKESPDATLVLLLQVWLAEQRGDREAADRVARSASLLGLQRTTPHPLFADSLLATGQDRAAVLDALVPYWGALPEKDRAWRMERDRAALDVLDGDFASAIARLRAVNEAAIVSVDAWRWVRATSLWLGALSESGDAREAARVASSLRRRLPGLPPNPNAEDWGIAQEPIPWLVDAEYRGGAITRAQRDLARDAWLSTWRDRAKAFRPYVWLHGWAAHVDTPEEARDALAALESYGGVPPFRPLTATNHTIGRTYLLAGRRAEAIGYLDLAARSTAAVEYPVAFVRSRLDQGIALEEAGEKGRACEAYAFVLARWGKAKPRSLAADEARRRAKTLGCP